MITTQLAHSLRAIHAAARPCGSAEDGRTVMAIHATPQRLADLLHAAQQLLDLQQAVSHEADLAQQAIDALRATQDDALLAELERRTSPHAEEPTL